MMPRVSVFIATSLDGFIARTSGELDWLMERDAAEGDEDYGYREFFDSVDTLVMGRRTFETVLSFGDWPYEDRKVVVLSRGTPEIPDELSGRVELSRLAPVQLVENLAEEGAKHIYVDGGKTIQGFLRAGLVHELTITRVPVLLGEGVPLFGKLDCEIWWEHIESRQFQNGFVQDMYRSIELFPS